MKRKVLLTLCLLMFSIFFIAPSVRADEYYDISTYDIEIIVNDDNSYDIIETLLVEFEILRHGIYRDIPTTHNDHSHRVSRIKVYNPNTNKKYDKSIERSNYETSIRIGDPDVYVEGLVPYEIAYTYTIGSDFEPTMDEFYFNLIGTQWDCTISQVTFKITMPSAFDVNALNFTGGLEGSTDSTLVDYEVNGSVITGKVLRPLTSYEAITIALPLPEGYYQGVASFPNLIFFNILTGLFFVASLYTLFQQWQYKMNNIITPVVSFHPPKGLTPPEIAYCYRLESLEYKYISPLILKWGSQGYLSITEDPNSKGKRLTFDKLKAMGSEVPHFEKELFTDMFNLGDGQRVTTEALKYKFHRKLDKTLHIINERFKKDKEILINKVQYLTKLYAVLSLILFTFIVAYLDYLFTGKGFFSSLLQPFICGLLLFIIMGISVYGYGRAVKIWIKLVIVIPLVCVFVGLSFVFFNGLLYALPLTSTYGLPALAVLFLAYLLSLFSLLTIRSYTPYAKELLGEIHGFRDFLETAKIDQLEMLFKENPEYFYDILPYAMVLDLTDQWSKYAKTLAVERPNWYYSTTPFAAYAFSQTMTQSFQTASAAPSSSGSSSSSGGSSGGGSGGGGGGSW